MENYHVLAELNRMLVSASKSCEHLSLDLDHIQSIPSQSTSDTPVDHHISTRIAPTPRLPSSTHHAMLNTTRLSPIDDMFMAASGLPISVDNNHMQQNEFDMNEITLSGRDEEGSEAEGEYRMEAHQGLNGDVAENEEPYEGDDSLESEYEDEDENPLEENPSSNIDHHTSSKSIEEATAFLARFNIIVDPRVGYLNKNIEDF
ncbi:hypothetical protein GGU10DRAFT_380577 [Lentinula aff. detonsa]|uniref:Uncharacterized protein n=1 Tax=Lentinula aff. detonsa TaxID=2804958 RepID=A0AA38KN84_9AGAR|nr:hypothetical protein GGU10DRAFT_380577 [Lentinula aff. detonsa]